MHDATAGFHVHLVSDSSGETVSTLARACLMQFPDLQVQEHMWWMVRSPERMDRVLQGIAAQPGLVMFTLVDGALRRRLEEGAERLGVPLVAVMDTPLEALGRHLGRPAAGLPGRQHAQDEAYLARIEAIHFTMAHDDGQCLDGLDKADVILLGVSRTSKTPTCVYLAHRLALKAANVPLVNECTPPARVTQLSPHTGPLIVGLTRESRSLSQIRQNRLREMGDHATTYADEDTVREEVQRARRVFARHGWPQIDVSRRSIEEVAANVQQLYGEHRRRQQALAADS